jgi:single-strand DNA-binding protein
MHGIHAAFTGRLGTNAELKYSKGDKAWVAFSVAVDTGKDGEGEASTTWVRVAVFGDKAEELAHKLPKGTEVYCEGRLSLGTWTGRDGSRRPA